MYTWLCSLTAYYCFIFRNLRHNVECAKEKMIDCNALQNELMLAYHMSQLSKLLDTNITCEITLPEPQENTLQIVANGVMEFMEMFTNALTNSYLLNGDATEMCSAMVEFRQYIYRIANLHAKDLVSKLVAMVTQLQRELCDGVEVNGKYYTIYTLLIRCFDG